MKYSPYLFALLLSSAANAQWTPKPQPVSLPKPATSTAKPPVAKPVSMPKPYAKPVKTTTVATSPK